MATGGEYDGMDVDEMGDSTPMEEYDPSRVAELQDLASLSLGRIHPADPAVGRFFVRAAGKGRISSVSYLLDQGVDPSIRGPGRETALHKAAKKGRVEMVGFLLEHPATNYNARDAKGNTPAYYALRARQLEVIRLLSDAGADLLNVCGRRLGMSLLHVACDTADPDAVRAILLDPITFPDTHFHANMPDRMGCTPLHYVAENGNKNIANQLLARGADVNLVSAVGRSPVHIAAQEGRLGVLRLFLDRPRNIPDYLKPQFNLKDLGGHTPLHVAVLFKRPQVVEWLLSYREVDPEPLNELGETPLFAAVNDNLLAIARLLVCRGQKRINERHGPNAITPLELSMGLPSDDMSKLLLRCGNIDVHVNDNRALSLAVARQRVKIVERILKRADQSVIDQAAGCLLGYVRQLQGQGKSLPSIAEALCENRLIVRGAIRGDL